MFGNGYTVTATARITTSRITTGNITTADNFSTNITTRPNITARERRKPSRVRRVLGWSERLQHC